MSLEGKNAIVTGSTSGIGLGMAEALAAAGCNVVLNGLGDAEEIERTRAGLEQSSGRRVLFSPANMLEPAAIADMVETCKRELGSVDVL
ncbi:MAG: SDR family NAD(P)-dependent oxidoreductase, partial [Gammaproteobacteria bacterium]